MPSVGFEPTISAGERPQTYALDRAATGTGKPVLLLIGDPNEDVRSVVSLEIRHTGREAALPSGVQFKNAWRFRLCLHSPFTPYEVLLN